MYRGKINIPKLPWLISNIHIFTFSGEDRAAEVENTESRYSEVTSQTNAATFSSDLGYNHKALSLSCLFCALKVTSGHKTLALHYASQHRDKLWACKECSYLALSQSSLAKHSKIHNKYPCNECDYTATTAVNLKQHKERKHPRHPCLYCDYSAITKGLLNEHTESKHKGLILWYSCYRCDYVTTQREFLKKHVESKH